MASAAWLHGPNITRLTEGLVSVLKEERPEHLPALLTNYREHGVVGIQVGLNFLLQFYLHIKRAALHECSAAFINATRSHYFIIILF